MASTTAPPRQGSILALLIVVAAVANLPLAVANVALPSIGVAFGASQTELNLVAVCYSLGLAMSVLWLGAVGDRYGRKQLLLAGTLLSLPACLAAAWAPTVEVLIGARLIGGLAAGMAYPTTLSLITALWSGAGRTRAIALWSASGGAVAALGPLAGGFLLERYWWGSVFLLTVPLVVAIVPLAIVLLPSHVGEATEPVDNLGGVLSVVTIGATILAINFIVVPDSVGLSAVLFLVGVVALAGFVWRERRAANPLFDLQVASRRVFWVAACAGTIVFGALMGAMFVGQQYVQNVLGYSTVEAGLAIVPAAMVMVLLAPVSARLVETRGSRLTLFAGYSLILVGFLVMVLFWRPGSSYLPVGGAYVLVAAGVGLAGTPASRSLTSSVPVYRAGMASGAADLQRDLGGAIMQSAMGALLTAGYLRAATGAIEGSPQAGEVSDSVRAQLTKSFAGAEGIAKQFPQYADQIVSSARQAFVDGQTWAYLIGAASVALGAALVWLYFPDAQEERELLASYRETDIAATEAHTAASEG